MRDLDRRLSLDKTTVAILTRHRAWAAERALFCGVGLAADGFVFSDEPSGNEPWLPNTFTYRFMDLCRRTPPEGFERGDYGTGSAVRLRPLCPHRGRLLLAKAHAASAGI